MFKRGPFPIAALDMKLAALHAAAQHHVPGADQHVAAREEWLMRKRLWAKKIPLTPTLKNAQKRVRQGRESALRIITRINQFAMQLANEGRITL